MSVSILPVLGGKTLTVSMAFGAAPDGDPALWSWTDITASILERDAITITRGRRDEAAQVEPSALSFSVANADGRFTPDNAGSPYFPNVKLRVPVRVVLDGSTRFSGFVDEWPMQWPGGVESWSTSSVRASGMWRRLAQAPPFKSTAEELISYLGPSSYYPMTDGPSALVWADRSAYHRPSVQVQFWTPGGRDWTSLNTDQSNGGVDRKSAAFYPSTLPIPVNGPVTIPFTGHNPPPAGGAVFMYYAIGYASDQRIVDLVDDTGALWTISHIGFVLTLSRTVGSTTTVLTSIGNQAPNPVLLNWYVSGPDLIVIMWTPLSSSGAIVAGASTVPRIISAVLHPLQYASAPDEVVAGHVALFDRAMTADELTLISNAFLWGQIADPTESNPLYNPEGWIRSRARLAGYRDSAITLDSAPALIDFKAADAVLGGKGRVEAMQVAANGELGMLYETLSGGVGFRNRASRYVASPWLTVDLDLGDLAQPPSPTFDDQNIVNDATVTQRQGIGRYVDQASVDSIGLFQKSVATIGYQSDTYSLDFDANQIAAWIVNTHSTPRVRVPQLTLRLSNRSALAAAWIAGEPLGSRVDVLNAPPQLGVASLSQFVEGYTETISMFEWIAVCNTSPADPYGRLFKVQDTVLGRLELDGQTLTSTVTAGATSWSVTTAAGKPLLTTTDVPFTVTVDGEAVTITAVTGASSPQTATVTRAAAGTTAAAHSAGAVLKLRLPGVLKI